MNIIFIFPTSKLGGAERVMLNLAKYLNSIGYNIFILVLSKKTNYILDEFSEKDKVKIYYINSKSDKNLLSYFKLFKILLNNNFDYIFTSHIITNSIVSLFLKFSKINSKHISRESTVPFERFSGYKIKIIKIMYRFFYGSQSLIIYQTEFMKKSLYNNLGFYPAKNNIVIENSVDIDNLDFQISNSSLEIDKSILNIVSCSRLIPLKKIDNLLYAYSKFVKDFDKESKLFIIGDGVEFKKLKKISSSLGLDDYVVFTGNIKYPAQYFAIADIGIISSEVEGFPNVILEMMFAGTKKIISTPCTPAICELPSIEITDGFSEKDLYNSLFKISKLNKDNSLLYKKYIYSNRKISDFWEKVIFSMRKD